MSKQSAEVDFQKHVILVTRKKKSGDFFFTLLSELEDHPFNAVTYHSADAAQDAAECLEGKIRGLYPDADDICGCSVRLDWEVL